MNDSFLRALAVLPNPHKPMGEREKAAWKCFEKEDDEGVVKIMSSTLKTAACGCLYSGAVQQCPLHANAEALLKAARAIRKLIEDGQLVRNVSRDAEPGWAVRQLPFIQALKDFETAITACGGKR